MENQRNLSKEYKKRIKYTEKKILDYSQSVDKNNILPTTFKSLEPVLENYIDNSHPVVINIRADEDNFIRKFPLYFTYEYEDGSYRNIFTVLLLMLQKYYRVSSDFINIEKDKLTIHFAKVPKLDPNTKQLKIETREFKTIRKHIINPKPDKTYIYNNNLYSFLINDLSSQDSKSAAPYFPLHLLTTKDGKLKILDGWEIFDACSNSQNNKIDVVFYKEKDIVIKTDSQLYNAFNINFSGREAINYQLGGESKTFNHINTYSYKDVYYDSDVPSLPIIKNANKLSAREVKQIESWFRGLVNKKANEVKLNMQKQLGASIQNPSTRKEYYLNHPWESRYVIYQMFLEVIEEQFEVKPGGYRKVIDIYPEFLNQMEIDQIKDLHLTKNTVLETLNEHYQQEFGKFYNKFVFSGAYTRGIGDVKQTPYGSMFGVNVIINAFNTIITENQWNFLSDVPGFNLLFLLAVCLIVSLIYGLLNIRFSSYIFIAIFFSLLLIPIVLFHYNYSLYIIPAFFGNVITFLSLTTFKLLTEEKDKKFLKATFSSYLSPEVIDDMYSSKQMPQLGGEARNITAFFTDIEKFSTFSEKLTAPQLVELLNEYLSAMTDILLMEQGTLDKYEGDAIIAFIGAPKSLPDNALRACLIAIKMQHKLLELRDKWQKEFIKETEEDRNTKNLSEDQWAKGAKWPKIVWDMRMRIGLNTGHVVVGNMGSQTRMNYTMMGDSVNLAARLEAGAKQYGVYTLISEMTLNNTWQDENGNKVVCKDFLDYRYIDKIVVVGKSEPVSVYEIIAEKGQSSPQEKQLCQKWALAMELFLQMEWEKAKQIFIETKEIERIPSGKTTPSKVMIERCQQFQQDDKHLQLDENGKWDGVYVLTSK